MSDQKPFLDFGNQKFSAYAFLNLASKQDILKSLEFESQQFGSHYISQYIGPLIPDFCQKEYGIPFKALESIAMKSETNSTI